MLSAQCREVVNRQESYQHAPASSPKKAEGKKRKSPCTPFREKGKGKESKPGALGTCLFAGAGAERIVAACDGEGSPAYYRACFKRALNRLRNRPELQKTLRLVVKNGNRREDSMWEILDSGRCHTWEAAKPLYWTHLKKMLKIFCGQ